MYLMAINITQKWQEGFLFLEFFLFSRHVKKGTIFQWTVYERGTFLLEMVFQKVK